MSLRNFSKTVKTPRKPWERERLDSELILCGRYGLKNKREVWRARYALAKIRSAARILLTLDPKNPKRVFEGKALLRRLTRLGLLDESKQQLDYALGLKIEDILERRLQTIVERGKFARTIHHARVLVRHRHIRVGRSLVNSPSFLVRTERQPYIGWHSCSPFGGGRPGRIKRKSLKAGKKPKTEGAATAEV